VVVLGARVMLISNPSVPWKDDESVRGGQWESGLRTRSADSGGLFDYRPGSVGGSGPIASRRSPTTLFR